MVITQEQREEMARILGQRHVSDKTAQDILLMCKAGFTAREAMSIRGVDNPCPDTLTDLKKKSEIFLLSSPELQELAKSATYNFLQGKPVIGKYKDKDGNEQENAVFPKASTIGTLIKEVADRTDPIKHERGNRSITNNIQVNMKVLDNPEPTQHVDIEETMDMVAHEKSQ
jgi:hypothetical protein